MVLKRYRVAVKKIGQRIGNCLPNLNLTRSLLYLNIFPKKEEFSSIRAVPAQKGGNP
jgi:hypothetical protein